MGVNSITLTLMHNAEMMSLQQSSIKLCIRFSKNFVYKSFTKGCCSSL